MTGTNPLPGSRTGRSVTPRQILKSMDGLEQISGVIDATYAYDGSNTNYEDELRSGLIMARITASKLWVPCKRSKANGRGNASTALTVDDARTFKAGDTVTIGGNLTTLIGGVKDNDNAASTGLAVYLHLDELSESPFGHLESVTAGNADSTFTIGNGGPVVKVEDDDAAATGGVAIYYDEDAANPDERFLAAVPTGKDAFILASDGRAIRIKYHATPATPGVLVYFDDDAANVYERLLFVSPTNADGTYDTDDVVGTQNAYGTRDTGNVIVSIDYSTNVITLTDAATWADDDAVYCDSLAGSEIPRCVLGEFIKLKDEDATWRDKSFSTGYVRGLIDNTQILGDLTSCLAATNYLNGIQWANQLGMN